MSRFSPIVNMILGLGVIGIVSLVIIGFQYAPLLMTVVAFSCIIIFGLNFLYQKRLNQMESRKWETRTRTLINASGSLLFVATTPFTLDFGEYAYLWILSLIAVVMIIPLVFGVLGVLLAAPSGPSKNEISE